jgi:hypothetical protein
MKKLLLVSAVISQMAFAECDIRSASINQSQAQVGPVTNLVKDLSANKCSVKFQISVNGKNQSLEGSWSGTEPPEYLCNYAVEQTRKQFLVTMGGTFRTDAVTSCTEGGATQKKLKIGDAILEAEAPPHPKFLHYFTHELARCRVFNETIDTVEKTETYTGVICQIKHTNYWRVVDKW